MYYDLPEVEISVLVPLDEEEDINELVEFFAAMHGLDEGRYYMVPITDRESYEFAVADLLENAPQSSYDDNGWVITFDPDTDPTIDIGEPSQRLALRLLRVIPVH